MTSNQFTEQRDHPRTEVFLASAPASLLTLLCLWNLWAQRASLRNVPFFSDAVLHEQMVRFATQSLLAFHLPFTQWYSLLNLGSPQFLHYQGLGATLTGFLGIFLGPNLAFRLSLYLLFALWPLAIYFSSRTFGLNKYAALTGALVATFLSSAPHIGYEAKAYEWFGYGVWAQLCASWTLPFAWAWTWRAVQESRHAWKAVLFIALTASLHYETGYSAFGAVLIFPLVIPGQIRRRLRNAALILLTSLLAASWVIVPLLVFSKWAALNTSQANSPLARGYGAGQNFDWLFHGQLFDQGRWPILTVAVGIGVIACVARWKRDPLSRAIALSFVLFFLVSFGPATWGSLTDLIPGHADIFFRRFLIPVDLSALYLVAIGVSWLGDLVPFVLRHFGSDTNREESRLTSSPQLSALTALALGLLTFALVAPSGFQSQEHNATNVGVQLQQQSTETQYIQPIISYVKSANNGRVYAGLPSNWGRQFRYGVGPMYMYLADNDVDQISTTGWAASLMEIPETNFDQNNLSDYEIFGARYLLLPTGMKPPVAAQLVLSSGPYQLWQIPSISYFSIVLPSGSVDENKVTIGRQAGVVMGTEYFQQGVDLRVDYGTSNLAIALPNHRPSSQVGQVLSENMNLEHGEASGTFNLRRGANVVLSASFDPGWQAFVDGRQVPIQMLAPALVSVPVPAGVHVVVFRYQGFRWYLPLFLLGVGGLIVAFLLGRKEIWWTPKRRENPSE